MRPASELAPEVREDLLRRAWYIHDAAWFAAVREELGIETANRLNRRAVHTVALAEARRLAKAADTGSVGTLRAMLEFIAAGDNIYVGPRLMEMEARQVDERSYQVHVKNCFVAEHIARAGMAESYECAVFERVASWHDALGLPLAPGQLPPMQCVKAANQECRKVLRLAVETK